MTRIVQLSDCHVAADPDAGYRGTNARANLKGTLQAVAAWGPDLLLATGDLSEDGSAASYAFLRDAITGMGLPVLAIPGNHDDARRLRDHFPDSATDAPLVHEVGGWRLVLLNSAVPNQVPGRLDAGQLAPLDRALAASSLPTLVALHHQPLPVGSPWIDRYPLLEPEPFWKVVERYPLVRLVVWGHVHMALEFRRGGVHALACPSTASNSLPGQERFTPDPAGPACRWLELDSAGSFATGILHAA